MNAIITLTTDFGLADAYVVAMKETMPVRCLMPEFIFTTVLNERFMSMTNAGKSM